DAFFKQVRLIGTTMGSPAEFEAMLRFVDLQRYVPEIHHSFALEQAARAHGLMEQGGQFGKIVLEA
ncbi:MAG TPA: zinc-binding dehydrogenase, partial [bacterium]|nr:zinc-binding dehydrogenase [bacterium]